MSGTQSSLPFYEEALEFLACGPTTQEIANYKFSPEAQARFSELIEINRWDNLTTHEEVELDRFVQMDQLFALLKVKAYAILDAKATP